jgi:putative colanic acid biosynthesis glycosyltransferase
MIAGSLPLVSIIVATYNSSYLLQQLIANVNEQYYKNKELIIIDGASTDDSIEVLQKCDGKITYWTSERDAGIYDALNKGIAKANGDWLYFMGVDDTFYEPNTLQSIFGYENIPSDAAMILGKVILGNNRVVRSRVGKPLYFKNSIHHQGVLYRRGVFQTFRYGDYNLGGIARQFLVSGDYQLNFRLFRQQAKSVYVDRIFARCGYGVSMRGSIWGYVEEIAVRRQHMSVFTAAPFDFLSVMRFVLKKYMLLVSSRS